MYRKLNKEDIAYLKGVTAPERVLTGNGVGPDYAHDELSGVHVYPEAVVRPVSTEEVSAVLRYASGRRLPVVPRGSGTGLVGGAVALHGGVMLETLLMNRIIELEEKNLTVTVQPGVLLMDLAAYTAARGFLYPPDPGEKSATIGGNISTNAGGMRAVKYGVTRDYVRGLTAVLPGGEVIETGGKVVKNSTGYSIKDLLVGSEGTLAVVTEAILKLVPLPDVTVSLLVPFPSVEEAIEAVPFLIQSKASLTAIEFMERGILLLAEEYLGKRFPDSSAPAYLLLSIDGDDRAVVDRQVAQAAELCIGRGALDAYLVDTAERREAVWNARGAFLEAIKASATALDECDVVVPRDQVARFIRYTREVAEKLGVRIQSFGHAGDGNLHVYVCRDGLGEVEWAEVLSRAFSLLYARARELRGLVSGEHGIGCAKILFMRETYGETQLDLMRGVKRAFDPYNILNPGKLF